MFDDVSHQRLSYINQSGHSLVVDSHLPTKEVLGLHCAGGAQEFNPGNSPDVAGPKRTTGKQSIILLGLCSRYADEFL